MVILSIHAAFKQAVGVAAHFLGTVERRIGSRDDLFGVSCRARGKQRSDARAGEQRQTFLVNDGLGEVQIEAVRKVGHLVAELHAIEDDGKLIPAKARDGAAGTSGFREAFRRFANHQVACPMTVEIVDVLEPIKIDEQQSPRTGKTLRMPRSLRPPWWKRPRDWGARSAGHAVPDGGSFPPRSCVRADPRWPPPLLTGRGT
jgi:hypothetical protein